MIVSMRVVGLALAGATAMAGVAHAGGFERGTADTDILFDDSNFAVRAGVTVVSPTKKLSWLGGAPEDADISPTYYIPSVAIKAGLTEDFACAGTYTTPFGGSSDYSDTAANFDTTTAGGTFTVSQEFVIHEFGLTCGYTFDLPKGQFTVLGGVFYQDLHFEQVFLGGANLLTLSDQGYGYRIGAAYEIPEIALRARAMYRSAVTVDATGDVSVLGVGGLSARPAVGAATFPQSFEVDVQSGIAPGWLAFGGVKWTDWSVFDVLDYNIGLGAQTLNFYWRDGWTINGGIARQFNEQLVGTVGLTWDRGVGTGHDLEAPDRWTVSAGGAFTPNEMVELRGGVAYTWFGAASQDFIVNPAGPGLSTPAPGIKQTNAGHAISGNLTATIKF